MAINTNNSIRKLINTKQDLSEFIGVPSKSSMIDGQTIISAQPNKQLGVYRKNFGRLFKSYMSSDGNQYVDRILTTNTLKYTNKFIDYRVFHHNFTYDLPATKIYVPWQGSGEQTALLEARSGYLSPFKMTCHKILFRTPAMDTAATDIVFGIEKIDSGDVTRDAICTFDATASWVDNTNFTIKQSDWSATPTVGVGDVVGISIQADNTNIVTSEKHFFMTSIWKIEVII
jgi:hypothetical protein